MVDVSKREVVSVSLGSPSRDWDVDLESLGAPIRLRRVGVGLDYAAYVAMLMELDGRPDVAAIGLGGINRYLFAGPRRYELRRACEMASVVKNKPVCDGSALKQHWEPEVVRRAVAAGALELQDRNALMVCAVDRWGMAEALAAEGATVVLGDLMFALELPIPVRSLTGMRRIAEALLPFVTQRVPFEWLYPTGESQPKARYRNWYEWAQVLAGDWKFIRRYASAQPGALAGKVILTNTTTPADIDYLRRSGAAKLITTTPNLGGRSLGTNVIEALISVETGLGPDALGAADIAGVMDRLGWGQPRVELL